MMVMIFASQFSYQLNENTNTSGRRPVTLNSHISFLRSLQEARAAKENGKLPVWNH